MLYVGGGMSYFATCAVLVFLLVPVLGNLGMDFVAADAVWFPRFLLAYLVVTNLGTYFLGGMLTFLCSQMPVADRQRVLPTIDLMRVRDASGIFWMAPYLTSAVLHVLLPFSVSFKVTGASHSAWWQDFELITPHLVYVVAVLTLNIYTLAANIDFENCIEVGAYMTYTLYQLVTIQQFIPIILHVFSRYGTTEEDDDKARKTNLIYAADGTPSVNFKKLHCRPGCLWHYSVLPVSIVLWFALTVYVTTSKETLGYECTITSSSL
jgi:hypothetical protein